MSGGGPAGDLEAAPAKRTRLAAPERRAAILDCACRVFAEGSFRGTTTSEIAGAAGVTEPILYRHFPSKRALYLACYEQTWHQVRELWDAAIASEPDPARWVRRMAIAYREAGELRDVISSLSLQALAEASEDPEIRAFMRRHLREVHDYVADVHRSAASSARTSAASTRRASSGSRVTRSTDPLAGGSLRPPGEQRSERGLPALPAPLHETATTRRLRLCGPAASPGNSSPRIPHPYLASRTGCEPTRLYRHISRSQVAW
jgi:AcrR family transcriptional regulator